MAISSLLLNKYSTFFKKIGSFFTKSMSGKTPLKRIQENTQIAQNTISILKSELTYINKEYTKMLAEQLRQENARLMAAMEDAKRRLIALEMQNGVKQVPVSFQQKVVLTSKIPEESQKGDNVGQECKPPKALKVKSQKRGADITEVPVDIGRLDLRIGKVEDVQRHQDADSLYVLKINCGEEKSRTVCSGLVKYVPAEKLRDKMVMLLCNLKPVKMRGIVSEAMVMCASSEKGVEVLIPPPNCAPGDLVHCIGYTRQPDAIMNPKKKIFETVATDLHTNNNLEACYKGRVLSVLGKGHILAETLKNVTVK
ncbi:aminoacyl tRNA synthase complex-interacting multifunctional protein 1 [Anthonomus grandis grandis]|uniref:aminoacyl tRNA synthase complex-interacting multifunctional protein 1 n=1 Tax=Anthonomus grandis grandis TaxID=2921223 RepID=UPI002165351F|nr:aminoacyl tRNA synthase complex-interacting multifunctional protein 1 [Anthonomus grandis grandis]